MSLSRGNAFAHSIQDRLKNQARGTGRPFAELLELYAVERFLHRLSENDLRLALEDVLRLEVEADGVELDPVSIQIQPIRGDSAVLGLRAKFLGRLGRMRLRFQIDVGPGDAVFPPTVELTTHALLGFPIATLRAYTPYTTIAEKLEAMVVLGEANSRTKDYYDLLELPRALAFDGPTLVASLRHTFSRRRMPFPTEPLEGLADSFARQPLQASRWRAFLAKNTLHATEADLAAAIARIRAFAQPAVDAARDGGPFLKLWPPGGPWR